VVDIHADQVEIDEIQDQVLDLISLDSNAYQITKLQVMEDSVLEEHWNGVVLQSAGVAVLVGSTAASLCVAWSSFVAWISCQLRWERRWAGVIGEVEHE